MTRKFIKTAFLGSLFLHPSLAAAAPGDPPKLEASEEVGATPQTPVDPESPAPPQAPASAAETTTPPSLPERMEGALRNYSVGYVDVAHIEMQAIIKSCLEAGPEVCPKQSQSDYYMVLAIILSGGHDKHDEAVGYFRAALTLNPQAAVRPAFFILPVKRAYEEAKTGVPAPVGQDSSPSQDAPITSWTDDPEVDHPPYSERKNRFIMVSGLIGGGGLTGSTYGSPRFAFDYEAPSGTIGVSAVGGFTPSDTAFSLGGRLMGLGATNGQGDFAGIFAASAVLGAVYGARQSTSYFHLMGGLGPAVDTAGYASVSGNFAIGFCKNGLNLGVSGDAGVGNSPYAVLNFNIGICKLL